MTNPATLPEKQFFTYAETAAILDCAEITIKRLVASGRMQKTKIGSAVRIYQSAIEKYTGVVLGHYEFAKNGGTA